MKLSIARDELQKGLARIQAVVEQRNSMPILSNVLLEARKGSKASKEQNLQLAATDLEVGIRSLQTADVDQEGELTISAKKIFELVRELPDEPVQLESTENSYLTIRCARAEFSLAGTSADEYPTLPDFTPKKTACVQAALLSSMIERTMYAASVDETRYNLNGVHLEVQSKSGGIRMVATDGHRLAYADRVLGSDVTGLTDGVIIPRKGLAELRRLADEEEGDEIELAFEGNHGLARKGGVTLVMRLIEGEFPDYHQVIPKESTCHLIISSEALIHALRRVAVFSSERSRSVKLELSTGKLALSSKNPDLGEAREELDVDFNNEPLEIGLNARYLLDAIGAMKTKEVQLSFRDPLSPVQIVPSGEADSLAVVMPMRL